MSRPGRRRHRRDHGACLGPGLPEWVTPIVLPTPYAIGPVTVYLLQGRPLTLVDAGPATRPARRALVAGLAASGRRVEEIERVLLTHGHHDHFGGAVRLQREGAEVFAHPWDAGNLALQRAYSVLWRRLRAGGMRLRRGVALVAAVRLLDATVRPLRRFTPVEDGDELPFEHGPVRVRHTPGHTPGHVAYELAGERVLVTGDTVLDGITPNAVVDADPLDPARPFRSIAAYRETLQRLRSLEPRLLLPSHGPCIADVHAQVARLLTQQDRRAAEVMARLEGGAATAVELVTAMFPHAGALGSFLAFSEVFGHLVELEARGEVVRVRERRRERWAARPSPRRRSAAASR